MVIKSFEDWTESLRKKGGKIFQPWMDYEMELKGRTEDEIWNGLKTNFEVMKEAIAAGLEDDMNSASGMVDNGGKKVFHHSRNVLSKEFKEMIGRSLSAKEVNSCMGRIVAAPTAGASGILPGILTTMVEIHKIEEKKVLESMLISAGIALIIERKASLSGAVGGCQAETGSAAAMGSGALVYCLGGDFEQISRAVAITIQCMLGLVCDPVAGLVEVPCVVRNASASAIAFSSAQMALAGYDPVIPVDECIEAMGEIGQAMEERYKETAQGGLAATKTGKRISKKVLQHDIETFGEKKERKSGKD
jgi:L-serine dehydratase